MRPTRVPKNAKPQVGANTARPPPGHRSVLGQFRFVQFLARPSDTAHQQRRLLEPVYDSDGSVEIAYVWRDHVMSQLHRRPGQNPVTIGTDGGCDILVSDASLPAPRHELLRVLSSGTVVHLLPEMDGEVLLGQHTYTAAHAARATGPAGLRLTRRTRVRLRFGEGTLFIRPALRPELVLPGGTTDPRWWRCLATSVGLHAVLLLLIGLQPPDTVPYQERGLVVEDSVVTISSATVPPVPAPLEAPIVVDEEADPPDEPPAPDEYHASTQRQTPGRPGQRQAPDQARRVAVAGPPETHFRPQRRHEPERTINESVVSVLEQLGPQSLFGERQARGHDDVTVVGYRGRRAGASFGLADLSIAWQTPSAGPERSGLGLGVGDLSTFGIYGGRRDDAADVAALAVLREPMEQAVPIEIWPCCGPQPDHGPDHSLVRRVLREHQRGFRACYERALRLAPRLAGRVELAFDIESSGRVDRARVADGDLAHSGVEACLVGLLGNLTFPSWSPATRIHVTYPLSFVPLD